MSISYAAILPYWFDGHSAGSGERASGREGIDLSREVNVPLDETLAVAIRDGDVHAFETLFTRYAASLATFAYRYTRSSDKSRDVVQDVFIRVWERRAQFASRGTVRGYLYAAVRNHALHDTEHAEVEARAADAFLATETSPALSAGTISYGVSPDTDLLRKEVATQVRGALAGLPPRARLIAMMRWQEGLSRDDVAQALGISAGTVNKQLTLAARALRGRLTPP